MNILLEIKKICSLKSLCALFVAFSAFNCINICKNYHPAFQGADAVLLQKGTTEIAALLEGDITEEKVDEFLKEYNKVTRLVQSGNFNTEAADFESFHCGYAFGDKNIFDEIYEEFIRQAEYSDLVDKIKLEAYENTEFFKEKGNTVLYNENRFIYKSFESRKITGFYYTSPASALFTYKFSSVLIIIILLFLFSPIFSVEKENEMLPLLHCTEKGFEKPGIKTVRFNKIKTVLAVVTLCIILFGITDFVTLKLCLKFNGLFQPVYVLKEFEKTSLTCSIFEFWLLTLALKWVAFVIMGIMFSLVSKTQSSSACSYIISLILTALLMLLKVFFNGTAGEIINLFNPLSLILIYKDFASLKMLELPFMFTLKSTAVIACNSVTFAVIFLFLNSGKASQRRKGLFSAIAALKNLAIQKRKQNSNV